MPPDALRQHLRPFQRRIRTVLAWRYGAISGTIGAATALLMDIGDWQGAWTVEPLTLIALIAFGVVVGIVYALWRPLPVEVVAQLIDRRAHLKDRVTTAVLCDATPFAEPLCEDAWHHLASVRPARLFRFRLTAWHGAIVALVLAVVVSRLLPQLPLPFTARWRQDRKEAEQMVEQVKRVLNPIAEHAKTAEASPTEKRLVQQLNELYRRAQQGRLSKKDAMVKLNKLLAEAQKLERQSHEHLRRVSTKAVTAAQTLRQQLTRRAMASQMDALRPLLQRMQELERQLAQTRDTRQRQALRSELQSLQRTLDLMVQGDLQALQRHMESLTLQMAQLRQMLQSDKDEQGRPLTEPEKRQLRQQLQSIQQQLQALQLSRQAQEFLRKLMSDPNFQEAMRRLAELQKQLEQLQQGQMPNLSPEELERMLRELERAIEELAKRYGDDEKIRELARQLLEAVKQMKAGGT